MLTVDSVRKAIKKLWENMTHEEKIRFSEKCYINPKVIDYFTTGDVMAIFGRTEEMARENSHWVASRVGYVLFTGQPYPRK
jgi:hypothetical protein